MTNEGQLVKHYEFSGVCPFCNGGKFEVVEVSNHMEQKIRMEERCD
jgi:hypothetical protein